MKSRKQQQDELNELHAELQDAQNIVVAQFQGITVAQDAELRQKIRAAKSKYRVVKNTIMRKAAEGTPAEKLLKHFEGSTAIAYNANDPVALAKTLSTYAKANPVFGFRAGMVEGRVVDIADLAGIAALPSREELVGTLMFLVKAPAQRLALTLNAVARNLAFLLSQAVEQKKFRE